MSCDRRVTRSRRGLRGPHGTPQVATATYHHRPSSSSTPFFLTSFAFFFFHHNSNLLLVINFLFVLAAAVPAEYPSVSLHIIIFNSNQLKEKGIISDLPLHPAPASSSSSRASSSNNTAFSSSNGLSFKTDSHRLKRIFFLLLDSSVFLLAAVFMCLVGLVPCGPMSVYYYTAVSFMGDCY